MARLSTQSPFLQEGIEAEVLAIVRDLLLEGGATRAVSALSPEAAFEADLGLGSLERVELLLRIETAFSITLPDTTIAEAQTVQSLVHIVLAAAPSGPRTFHIRLPSLPALKGRSATEPSSSTLTEALLHYAERDPDRPHIYLPSEQGEETLNYGDLLKGAQGIARGLSGRGLASGETVAIMLPSDRRFFECFFGVLFAGGIPVPVYPPFRPDQIEDYARRQTRILKNAEAAFLITFDAVERLAQLLRPMLPSLRGVTTVEALRLGGQSDGLVHKAQGEHLALIQYTSGSTSDPKGVALSHRNLIENIKSISQAMEVNPNDAGVSWLPLYHDMGLIGAWLLPLYSGIPVTILPPFSFLSRPERWLWAIHSHRATISPAPNFAYEMCAAKIKDEAIEGLDLSSWRIALNGAEPIKPETLSRFTKRFAPYGFRPEAFLPVYGMAEASVGLAFSPLKARPKVDRVSRLRFERDRQAFAAPVSEPSAIAFVSCGIPLPGHEIRIVDEKGKPLPERVEGNLVFRGPSCTSGYYRNEEATASLFQDGWLCSGDLGYWAEGELYITGRKKDLIIKGGRNLHPHEIEEVVGEIPGIRKGCVAAFGVPDQALGTEKLVVVAETRETMKPAREGLMKQINKALIDTLGSPADLIALSAPGSIPKTSSGKIAHRACRAAYLDGSLSKRRRMALQFARLAMASFLSWAKRGFRQLPRLLYGLYLALLLPPTVLVLWGAVRLLPASQTRGILKRGAGLYLWLAGLSPQIQGREALEKTGPVVWVANHASYADALFLTAVLPSDVRFVAKQELLKVPILRTFLRRGGHLTVDRSDVSKGASETEAIESILKAGGSVLIFPEGTFLSTAGLRPFKLGAFKAAVSAGAPVCSLALNGTRQLLRDGRWLPHWRRVTITLGASCPPKENVWREVVRLRDRSRDEIAKYCGESPLKS